MELDTFDGSEEFLAQNLPYSLDKIRDALIRLHEAGFVKKEKSLFKLNIKNVMTPTDIYSRAIQAAQLQVLNNAKEALSEVPVI